MGLVYIHGVEKIKKMMAEKDAVLTENLMFSNNPRPFLFKCNKIQTRTCSIVIVTSL